MGGAGGGGEREKGSFLLSCKVTVKFCLFTCWFGLFQGVVLIKMEIGKTGGLKARQGISYVKPIVLLINTKIMKCLGTR